MIDLEFVKKNCKEGWKLNPNERVVNGVIKGLNRCDGECPCANDAEDKQCPCSNYREHDKCCCQLYVKDYDLKVRVKKLHPDAVMPEYKHGTDAGMDLTAVSMTEDEETGCCIYGTGLAFEIPDGYVGYIFPRSSIYKNMQMMTNSVGVVDSGYRGEVKVVMYGDSPEGYHVGERVAQLIIMPYPKILLEEATELSKGERGANGYGSTGK